MQFETGAALLAAFFFALCVFLVLGFYRERSRHNKTRLALAETLRHFQLTSGNAPGMVLAYGMDRKLVYASPGFETLTGYSADDLGPQGHLDWVHSEDEKRMRRRWDDLFQGCSWSDEEYRIVARGGRVLWLSSTWRPILDHTGLQIGVQGGEQDITARKRMEQALDESEHRFRELLDTARVAAVMVDLKGYVCYCNDHALTATGWARDEVIGHPGLKFIDPEHRRRMTAAIEQAKETGRLQTPCESALITRDGEQRWYRWSSIPLRGALGESIGFASLGVDVQVDARAVSQVAHDLNNVLAVIQASIELIAEHVSPNGTGRQTIAEIQEAGTRGFQLTQQLFSLSRKRTAASAN